MKTEMSFYLTQRLTRRDTRAGSAFDGYFACQYMGAAEFEWGALPESLKNIRSVRRLGVHTGRVTRGSVTVPVFVVGDVTRIEAVPGELTRWMLDDHPRGQEATYFPECVTGALTDYQRETHAWWSLSDDVMWALDADTADLLLAAVSSR